METVTAKWIILVVLFMLTIIFSMLPIIVMSSFRLTAEHMSGRVSIAVSLLSCFAGGVFMATGLLDIFPEVNKALLKASWGNGYPVAEFLVAVGFFLVLTVEQIVLDIKESASHNSSERTEVEPLLHQSGEHVDARPRQGSFLGVSDHPLVSSTSTTQSENPSEIFQGDPHSSFRSIIMAAALSLHSVFEGLAIGLQPDMDSLLKISIAVALHKSVIAFSLGLNLVHSQLKKWAIIETNIVFCLASPIGLACALGLEEFGHSMDSSAINGILQGLACGTFFYVTFFEVLPHELNLGGNRMLKMLAIIIGFSLISGVLFLDPENRENKQANLNVTSYS